MHKGKENFWIADCKFELDTNFLSITYCNNFRNMRKFEL